MIDINGMAHVILTVSQFEKAHRFYSALLPQFGMTKVNDGPDFLYHVGARTAIGIRRCDPEFEQERFEQYRVGLHHIPRAQKAGMILTAPQSWLHRWGRRLFVVRRSETAPGTTMYCLKTLMAFA